MILSLVTAIYFLYIAMKLFVDGEYVNVYAFVIGLGNSRYVYASIFFLLSLLFFYISLREYKKSEIIDHSKCPNCKESFNYHELKNGKCKNCKDVDTIETEEYYKKYPEELDDV